MIQVTIEEAQRRLPELLSMVQAGEGMEIYADSGWIFRVVRCPPCHKRVSDRPVGSAAAKG